MKSLTLILGMVQIRARVYVPKSSLENVVIQDKRVKLIGLSTARRVSVAQGKGGCMHHYKCIGVCVLFVNSWCIG